MRNREEAIQWLVEHGYHAFPRDWAVGESIDVAKRLVESAVGLQAYEPTLVYIYPDREGGWLVQPPLVPSRAISFSGLREGVCYALELLEGWEIANSLPISECNRLLTTLSRIGANDSDAKSGRPAQQ